MRVAHSSLVIMLISSFSTTVRRDKVREKHCFEMYNIVNLIHSSNPVIVHYDRFYLVLKNR